MNATSQFIAVLIVMALFGTMAVGGYLAVEYIAAVFLSMDPQVARVTGLACAAVLLAALLVATSIRQANRRNWTDQFRAEKAATYRRFLDIWTCLLQEPAGRINPPTILSSDTVLALGQSLVLYASPAVIKAHGALRAQWSEGGVAGPEIQSQFAKALVEIRKDLGSGLHGLTADQLQNLFFPNDDAPGRSVHRDGSAPKTASVRRSAEAS